MKTKEWVRKAVVCEQNAGGLWEVRLRFLFEKDGVTEARQGSFVFLRCPNKDQAQVFCAQLLTWLTNYTHLTVSSTRHGDLENELVFTPEALARLKAAQPEEPDP